MFHLPTPLAISSALTIAAAIHPQIAAVLVILFLAVFVICIFLICLEEDEFEKSFGNGNEINEVDEISEVDDGREGEEDFESLHLTHSEPIPEKWLDEYVNVPHPLPVVLHELPKVIHPFVPGDFLECVDDSGVQHYIRNSEGAWFLRNHTDEGRLIWVRTCGKVKGVFCSAPERFKKVEGRIETP